MRVYYGGVSRSGSTRTPYVFFLRGGSGNDKCGSALDAVGVVRVLL